MRAQSDGQSGTSRLALLLGAVLECSAQAQAQWFGAGGDSAATTAERGALPGWVDDARTICRDMAQTQEMYTEAPYPPRNPADEIAKDEVKVDGKITPAAIAHHLHGGTFPTPVRQHASCSRQTPAEIDR